MMKSTTHDVSYERRLVAIFFLTWGLIFLDRQTLPILMPLMLHDLPLTNGEVGQVNMWQTIGYAVSAPIFALFAERLGNRKFFLLLGVFGTAVFSLATMWTNSLESLLIVRTLLGVSEGLILPLAVALVAQASRPGMLGRNVGFVYAGAAVIASTLGPIVVTQVAQASSWQVAFLFVSIPSFIAGILILLFVRKDDTSRGSANAQGAGFGEILGQLRTRNILVCVFISIFAMAGLWSFNSFLPLFLTSVSGMEVTTMGLIMSAFGIFTIFWQIFLPYSSDKIGRKPAMLIYALLAATTPALLFFFPKSVVTIVVYIGIGGIIMTLTSLFNSIIPVESVRPAAMATASAVIMGTGELLGSFAVGGAGALADQFGLPVVMLVSAASYIVVFLVSFGLRETRRKTPKGDVETPAVEAQPVAGI